MSRPASLRLPEEVRTRLDDESRRIARAPSSLAVVLIDEGLKMRWFGGIVFRDGPTGRRAGLASGPDVWEIVRDLKRHGADPDSAGDQIQLVAEETGLAPELIGLAADYYATFPDEIDDRIAADARAAEEMRALADRRERMQLHPSVRVLVGSRSESGYALAVSPTGRRSGWPRRGRRA